MTTPDTRAIVSFATTMAVTLALGACAPGPSVPALDRPATIGGRPLTIRFDNDGREHVHVYLVDWRQHQYRLGRIDPWSRATLRIPEAALAGSPGLMRLVVITGERLTLQATRDPRARFSAAQSVSAILSQRWMFAQGQLTPLPLGARVDVNRQ
jgi:hypothetical protein